MFHSSPCENNHIGFTIPSVVGYTPTSKPLLMNHTKHVYITVYVCIHIYICMCIYIYVYVCVYIYMYIINMYIINIHIYILYILCDTELYMYKIPMTICVFLEMM